jgi:hypothetical protein
VASRRDLAIFAALLPAEDHPVLARGLTEAGFADFLDEVRRDAPRPFRLALRLALFAATWLAPLLIRRPPPLWIHRSETRERALVAMAGSRVPLLRQLVRVLKHVASLCYGADAEVRRAVGYRATSGGGEG